MSMNSKRSEQMRGLMADPQMMYNNLHQLRMKLSKPCFQVFGVKAAMLFYAHNQPIS